MNQFELIIFDCDGVLVDSERLANQVFAEILRQECGLSFSLQEMFETFVGRSSAQCMAIIEEMLGKEPPANLEQQYHQAINQALFDSVEPVKHIEICLKNLSIPYCVASSGSHEKMQITLGKTGLLQYVSGRIYSATSDVDRGKPHPDIYLHAAKQAGVTSPSRCLVVEDSPMGVTGGVAAGMTVFGYAELTDRQRLLDAGAHHILDDMSELIDDIKRYEQTLSVA